MSKRSPEGEPLETQQTESLRAKESIEPAKSAAPDSKNEKLVQRAPEEEIIYNHPTQDQLRRFSELVADNTHLIPKEIRAKLELGLMQERLAQASNQAYVNFASELERYFELYPEEGFLLKFYLEAAALAFKKRLVDDELVSKSYRQAKTKLDELKNQGRLKQIVSSIWGNKYAQQTALIEAVEETAATLEGIRLEQASAAQELATIRAELEKVREEKARFIEEKNLEAASIIDNAQAEARRIKEEANTKAEVTRALAKAEREKIERESREEEAKIDARVERKRKEEALLNDVISKLRKEPGTAENLEHVLEARRQKIVDKVNTKVRILISEWKGGEYADLSIERGTEDAKKVFSDLLDIIDQLALLGEQFGEEEVTDLTKKLVLDYGNDIYKLNTFIKIGDYYSRFSIMSGPRVLSWLRFLSEEKVSYKQFLEKLNELYRSFLKQVEALNQEVEEKRVSWQYPYVHTKAIEIAQAISEEQSKFTP
jgi:hypothetical protein